ncbi:MAG: 6-hydroxymethylpterin diphosphokinase MptE-like protein [Pseudomonadota bacterium]
MPSIAIVTMVQKRDLPSAFASLENMRRLVPPQQDGAAVSVQRLILLNDERDASIEDRLRMASGGEVISEGRNLGVAGGRNFLVRAAAARGADYILSIDDDIILPPDFLQLLWADYVALNRAIKALGILTPATLDFPSLQAVLFDEAEVASLAEGRPVKTPLAQALLEKIEQAGGLSAQNIYHMGIRDWRGCYLFTDHATDKIIQSEYGVEPSPHLGAQSNLKNAPEAGVRITSQGDPVEVDTAPGGICFYSTAMFNDIGGVDEIFNPFGYEDADFALRAKQKGYRHFCAPRALALHDIAFRLSARSLEIVKATQGKITGVLARRNLGGAQSAAGVLAVTRRVLDDVGADGLRAGERDGAFPSLRRLKALLAYVSNLVVFALPEKAELAALSEEQAIQVLKTALQSIFPSLDEKKISISGDGARISVRAEDRDDEILDVHVRRSEGGTQICVGIDILKFSMRATLLPSLLRDLTDDDCLSLSLSVVIGMSSDDSFELSELKMRIPGGFALEGALRGRRGENRECAVRSFVIESSTLHLRDEGALPRLVHSLSRIEEKNPETLLAAYKEEYFRKDRAPLFAWLSGAEDSLSISWSGAFDGMPSAPELSASFAAAPHAGPNKAQQWLLKYNEPPVRHYAARQVFHANVPVEGGLVAKMKRLVSEDPSVTPFPETYRPALPTKISRKLRYMAASRGVALTPNEKRILSYKDYARGKRAFVIGNGPSLNKVDLSLLKNEVTFGVNAIYLNREKMGFLPTHYIVEDIFVAEDRADEINALHGPTKWIGNYLRYCLSGDEETCWLNVACDYSNYLGFPHFSDNAARIVWVGGTVSYIAMQLAFFMGYDQVYLVGFDHSYSVPKDAKVEGRAITSVSDDPNHFHPDYFGKGYRWHDPRVDRMEAAYQKARSAFRAANREILNATAGGKLEVFDRVDFESLF